MKLPSLGLVLKLSAVLAIPSPRLIEKGLWLWLRLRRRRDHRGRKGNVGAMEAWKLLPLGQRDDGRKATGKKREWLIDSALPAPGGAKLTNLNKAELGFA